MRALLLKQHVARARQHLAIGELQALADNHAEYEHAYAEFCLSMGWLPCVAVEWRKEAEGKCAEILYADAAVGIGNLLYVQAQNDNSRNRYEQLASRWLTYLRVTHERVFSQLNSQGSD